MKGFKIKIPLKQYILLLESYLKPQWRSMLWLTLLLFAGIAMQLIHPLIIRYFIDTAQETSEITLLFYAAALFIGVALLQQGLAVVSAYIGEYVGWTATNQLRGDVAGHVLRLDQSFHKEHTSGEIIERVDGDINALANFFSSFVVVLAGNLLLMIGILVVLFWEDWRIGLPLLLFSFFAIFIIQHIRKYAVPHWAKLRQMNADFFGYLSEHLDGTEDTRANGATEFVMHRFHLLLRQWLPIRVKAFMGWAAMWISTLVVFTIGTAVAFGVSAYLWRQGAITIGTAYMIFHYTELLAKPIEKIRTQMEDLQKADASIGRIEELMAIKSKITDGRGDPLPQGPLSVSLEDVSFGYEDHLTTLSQIDLHVKPGQVLGVIGRTGSGKTTLARLLLRFYDPTEGKITLGGVDLRNARLAELRQRVAMVTQTIEIFQGSVRDNLTFFDESIADVRIVDVLKELGLRAWYQSLPSGLDTELESGGGGLSAGEAQLIAFARVFLTDPGLVILDEASSRLDPATEQLLEAAMNKLLHERTCIIIAHRLSTLMRADAIAMLEDGRLVEYGERQTLMEDPQSRFSQVLSVGMEEVLS